MARRYNEGDIPEDDFEAERSRLIEIAEVWDAISSEEEPYEPEEWFLNPDDYWIDQDQESNEIAPAA